MSPQTRAHILNGLAKKNSTCLRFVASVGEDGWDCRRIRDQESRQAIYAAREEQKKQEQEERRLRNQSRPAPPRGPPPGAVEVGTYSSRGSADGSTLYQGLNGGLFTLSAAGNRVSRPSTESRPVPAPSSSFSSACDFGGMHGMGRRDYEPSFSSASFASRPSSSSFVGFHSSTGSANGRELRMGPRGGVYYETPSGGRSYVKRRWTFLHFTSSGISSLAVAVLLFGLQCTLGSRFAIWRKALYREQDWGRSGLRSKRQENNGCGPISMSSCGFPMFQHVSCPHETRLARSQEANREELRCEREKCEQRQAASVRHAIPLDWGT